jgi:hypothetical protein
MEKWPNSVRKLAKTDQDFPTKKHRKVRIFEMSEIRCLNGAKYSGCQGILERGKKLLTGVNWVSGRGYKPQNFSD